MSGKNKFNKKIEKKKFGIILLFSVLILALAYSFTFNSNLIPTIPDDAITMSNYFDDFFEFHTIPLNIGNPYFDAYFTERDFNRIQQNLPAPVDGMKLIINESSQKLIDILKPNDSTVVIFPTFTSAAYHEPGFYTYFGGGCDESCITDLSFENVDIKYTSSGTTAQILYAVGYDFVTDIDVDKNPKILQNYDTVILLHNEYVTKKMFDAITSHPHLIFLAPNALYAEIDVNYDDNTMSLIRGHDYPPGIANGFDYEIEEQFHEYEYDDQCLEWEFIKIKNGYHLNCYPDGAIHENFDILLKLKEL